MSRLPAHRTQSHAEIRARLLDEARRRFPDHRQPGGWDPTRPDEGAGRAFDEDLGRGLLDAFALALHVLWTYQEAWSAEGFLPLAELDGSVTSLLAAIGYQPAPGTAAIGLVHLRCVEGTSGIVPTGFGLSSPARGEELAVSYETLQPLRLDPALNELRAWSPETARSQTNLPGSAGSGGGGAAGGAAGSGDGDTSDVPRLAPIGTALGDRLAALAGGDLAARRAARARVEMRRLADTLQALRDAGGEACSGVLDALCAQLCEAQKQAAAAPLAPAALSDSQKLARKQLGRLGGDAGAALDRAMARGPGETDAEYRARLDAMAKFLDSFVAGLVQNARDEVVLLRGPRTLARLDRAVRGVGPSMLGTASPGTDSLLLVSVKGGRLEAGTFPMLRPGDWLVLGEELERLDDEGRPVRDRLYREAVRVVGTQEEAVPGVTGRFTRVTFEPPLARAYRLDTTFLIGNLALASAGRSVEELALVSLDGRTLELSERPLTWLAAPREAGGRRPECRVWVGGDEWTMKPDLLAVGSTARAFAVEAIANGGARLRFGDGINGALLPAGAEVRVRYRIGLGESGNRAALRVDSLQKAHPAVNATFNPLPFVGGTPAENAAAARTLAPAALRAMDRAVSLADLEALALTFGGVQRARVQRGASRGQLRVTVSGFGRQPLAHVAGLTAFLQARVAPGLSVVVRDARAVEVHATVVLRLDPGADALAVMASARVRLGADDPGPNEAPGLLHPDQTRIDGDLRLSEVYAALEHIDGLSSCLVKQLFRRSYDSAGRARPLARIARGLSDVVVAQGDERLVWGRAGEGVVLEVEEERDR